MHRSVASMFFLALGLSLAACGGSATPEAAAPPGFMQPAPAADAKPAEPQEEAAPSYLRINFTNVMTTPGWVLAGQKDLDQNAVEHGLQFVSRNSSLGAKISVYAIRTEKTAGRLMTEMHDDFAQKGTEVGDVVTGSNGSCFPFALSASNVGMVCSRVYEAQGITLTFAGNWPASNADVAGTYFVQMANNLKFE